MRFEIRVRRGKGPAAEKPVRGRQRRGVNTCQYQMACPVDDRALVLRLAAPQDKDKILALAVQRGNHRVGKGLPSLALMRSGAPVLDGETGIEKQHALACPAFKIAMSGMRNAQITLKLAINVLKGWWRGDAARHGKTEPMRLSRPVIGVLAEDHHLHIIERRQLKGAEHPASRRVDAFAGGFLGAQEGTQRHHMRCCELAGKPGLPACLDPHILVRRGNGLRHAGKSNARWRRRQPVRRHERRQLRFPADPSRSAPDADTALPPVSAHPARGRRC